MKKEEYANAELDELIPMVLEIFAQIDVQTISLLYKQPQRLSVRPSVTFCNKLHNSLLREPILSLFVLPARSRHFAHFCLNRFSILVPSRPWERSQGLRYRPVRFPVPAKLFANFVTALSLLLRAPEPSWRCAATVEVVLRLFRLCPGPHQNSGA